MAFVKTITTDDGQTAELHFEATMSDMKELLDSDLYKSLSEMQKLITENMEQSLRTLSDSEMQKLITENMEQSLRTLSDMAE